MDKNLAADYVAAYSGGAWSAMGSGSPNGGAVNGIVRALGASGTDVYVGTDAVDVAGIAQADHVARWNGSTWSATGSDTSGGDGWFPASTSINGIATSGVDVVAAGSFQNADGNPLADIVAAFDGTSWRPIGSDGAGNGPLNGTGQVVGFFNQKLHAGGNFTSAGGDPHASFAAVFDPQPAGLPAPALGETVNAAPANGTVLVRLPATAAVNRGHAAGVESAPRQFLPLTEAQQLPLGSTFDTTRGAVKLTLAGARPGTTQAGRFSKGRFRTAQSKRNALTTMTATGGGLARCGTRVPTGGAPRVQASARSRSLFGSARGRFRTRGRHSSATVRGTQWLQKDTCAGTLTTVKKGSVVVRDFTKRRNVVVKRGKRYLARALRR
jgi:hypothetical protein